MEKNAIVALVIFFALGVAYLAWMETGCEGQQAVMTWSGKVCYQDL